MNSHFISFFDIVRFFLSQFNHSTCIGDEQMRIITINKNLKEYKKR
jgi:hypothetical protein